MRLCSCCSRRAPIRALVRPVRAFRRRRSLPAAGTPRRCGRCWYRPPSPPPSGRGPDANAPKASGAAAGGGAGVLSPLHAAAEGGWPEAVAALLDAGADIEELAPMPGNPGAREQPSSALLRACGAGHHAVVAALASRGADVDFERQDGLTPLLLAASRGNEMVVRALVGAGADVNRAQRGTGMTPILVAASRGDAGVLGALIEAGADVNAAQRRTGLTPLAAATRRGNAEAAEALVAAGAAWGEGGEL